MLRPGGLLRSGGLLHSPHFSRVTRSQVCQPSANMSCPDPKPLKPTLVLCYLGYVLWAALRNHNLPSLPALLNLSLAKELLKRAMPKRSTTDIWWQRSNLCSGIFPSYLGIGKVKVKSLPGWGRSSLKTHLSREEAVSQRGC